MTEMRLIGECECGSGKWNVRCCHPELEKKLDSLRMTDFGRAQQAARENRDAESCDAATDMIKDLSKLAGIRIDEARHAEEERLRMLADAPVTAESVKQFYEKWDWLKRNTPFISLKRKEMTRLKDRIVQHMLNLAADGNWFVWRKANVLYIETPYGQCSFHIVAIPLPDWFVAVVERQDLEWSGKRESDIVIRRTLGDTTVGRKRRRPSELYLTSCHGIADVTPGMR